MPEAYKSFLEVLESRLDPLNTDAPATARNGAAVPAALLGHLAWSRGRDYWDSAWSESSKRQLTIDTPSNLRLRGTRSAIESALAALATSLIIEEWFESDPEEDPGTAKATILAGTDLGNDAEAQATVGRILERESRLSVHWAIIVGASGADALAPHASARITVLTQHSGVQVGA